MNIRDKISPDDYYVFEGRDVLEIIKVMDRLYDDLRPMAINERRDLAQRLHAQLEKAVVIDEPS